MDRKRIVEKLIGNWPKSLIMPYFVVSGKKIRRPVPSMPGVCQLSIDQLIKDIQSARDLGIRGVILFGIPPEKDLLGSGAYADDGIVQEAVKAVKAKIKDMLVVTDVCLCEYTSHGHCCVLKEKRSSDDFIDLPRTLKCLAATALSHARAGADMVAPSAMMKGQVAAIRTALDEGGFLSTPIMGYSAKYASAFYGPFRDAAGSAPQFGDRRSYQLDPCDAKRALREVADDLQEGADIVMVKPALAYLDIIRQVKDRFHAPLAAYNVSAEYAMVKAAAKLGWVDEKRIVLEILTGIKRAGAEIIISYHACDVARWMKGKA